MILSLTRDILAECERKPRADAWWEQVVELQIAGRGIRRMQGLERLSSLQRASFAHNEISHIQGLDACLALQELSFEARLLHCLLASVQLKKLLLSCNRGNIMTKICK